MAKATITLRQSLNYQAKYAAYFAANQSLFNRVVAFYFEVIARRTKACSIFPPKRPSRLWKN